MTALSIVVAVIVGVVLIAIDADGDNHVGTADDDAKKTPISGSGYERAEVNAALVDEYCTGGVEMNEATVDDGFDIIQCSHAEEGPNVGLVTFVVSDSPAELDAFFDRADRAGTIPCDGVYVRGPQWAADLTVEGMAAADPEPLYDLGGEPAAAQPRCS